MDTMDKDTVCVNLNSLAAEQVKQCYGELGWQVCGERKKKFNKNVVQVKFCRPHFINFKDELLLLQVRIDIEFNQMGKIAANRLRRSALSGAAFGAVSLLFFAWSALLFTVFSSGAASVILAAAACLFGVCSAVAGGLFSYKFFKVDTVESERLIACNLNRLRRLCESAKLLRTGGRYGCE